MSFLPPKIGKIKLILGEGSMNIFLHVDYSLVYLYY